MNAKKAWEELLEWGSKNETNRKKAITATIKLLAILHETHGKKLSKDELQEISGGFDNISQSYT